MVSILQGCLVFHSSSYEIKLGENASGTVEVNIKDIRSDAMNSAELNEDKNQLFQYYLKSEEFISQLKDEGKNIFDRKLFVKDGKLSGTVQYSFDDISKVEGIVYQDPYYFLTLGLEDSVISTNGEVIVSKDHKRIMWDNSIKILKFEMFSTDVEEGNLTELTKYLEE
jgi:hypothetical protein